MRALALILASGPVWADCPPAPDHRAEMAELHARAQAAGSEAEGRTVTGQMWALWTAAPDEPAQEMLDRGMAAIRASDLLGAMDALDRLVAYCPDYAEGWNQRAFAEFLAGRMEASRADLERALALEPDHVAALTGLALVLTALGDVVGAQARLRDALRLNPWLPERALLTGEEL